jgi:peptide/nickel transport system permease protein
VSDAQATVSPAGAPGAAGTIGSARFGGQEIAATKPRSPLSNVWRQFRRSKTSLAGVVLLALLVGGAVFAPVFAPYDFDQQTRDAREAPSRDHIFGTDTFGRDIYSRVLYGGRLSLTVGVISVGIGLTVGTMLGLLGGYVGRWVDGLVGIFTDVMLAFPSILLAMAIIAILGRSLTNVMIAVGIASIPAYIRLVRSSVIAAKNLPYVEAAQVIGCGAGRVMLRHLLPNVIGPVTVLATLSIATAILTAAGLSFLGLGAQPPTPEWGAMVSDGRQYLRSYWWIVTMPGIAIMLTVLAINLIGDGLRDAIDPRLRR